VGPWLVPANELAQPRELALTLEINGERRQHGNTADMIFGVNEIVSYCSRFMKPKLDDLIVTGTSADVGLGMRPPQYPRDGDVVDMRITGLGT
jgi:2-keto-4-pentenoate hydratase/2-oxohepta-3-ene-1,7-dioic acid hydratase in catechol pathway